LARDPDSQSNKEEEVDIYAKRYCAAVRAVRSLGLKEEISGATTNRLQK